MAELEKKFASTEVDRWMLLAVFTQRNAPSNFASQD